MFVDGIAVFTRLRVNKPSSDLRLSFITNPGSFEATTSMSFSVVEPSDDVIRKEIILKFIGNTATLSTLKYSDVIDDLKLSLSQILDVDLSRIQNVEFIVNQVTKLNNNIRMRSIIIVIKFFYLPFRMQTIFKFRFIFWIACQLIHLMFHH